MILKLLMAWKEPLGQLHQSMAQEQDVFNSVNSNKALDMSNMVHELRKGVKKVVEKVPAFSCFSLHGLAWRIICGEGRHKGICVFMSLSFKFKLLSLFYGDHRVGYGNVCEGL